jgi:rhodanese-related sulfurtransferase
METPLLTLGQSMHLFNMQISELPLIIDARPPTLYKQSHVIGAINVYHDVEGVYPMISIPSNDLHSIHDIIGSQLIEHIIDNSCDATSKICIYDDMTTSYDVSEEIDFSSNIMEPSALLHRQPPIIGFSRYIINYINNIGIPRSRDSKNMVQYYVPQEIIFIPNYSDIIPSQLPYIIIKDSTLRYAHDCSIISNESIFFPSMILPWGLFLGSKMNINNIHMLSILKITTIINVSSEVPNYFECLEEDGNCGVSSVIKYHRFECSDDCQQSMVRIWEEASAIIESCRVHNSNVIVHCHAGRSRSASTVMYYLMKHQHMGLVEAYDYCQSCRPIISPNPGFMRQLRDCTFK